LTVPGPEVIADYQGWLHQMARVYSRRIPDHDDLAQEGRIAMWKALGTYDPALGSLPSWLTTAAKFQMRKVAQRGTWTGTPMRRGHVREQPAAPMDINPEGGFTPVAFMPDTVEMAYHQKEIFAALSDLPDEIRTAVFRKFWLDEPSGRYQSTRVLPGISNSAWYPYRDQLARRLAHLKGI
jgi:RNA polymerase sigma factor (sigma-70 family)